MIRLVERLPHLEQRCLHDLWGRSPQLCHFFQVLVTGAMIVDAETAHIQVQPRLLEGHRSLVIIMHKQFF